MKVKELLKALEGVEPEAEVIGRRARSSVLTIDTAVVRSFCLTVP